MMEKIIFRYKCVLCTVKYLTSLLHLLRFQHRYVAKANMPTLCYDGRSLCFVDWCVM